MAKWHKAEDGTRYRVVDGVKYAEGVEPGEPGSDPEVAAELAKPLKVRITTFVDADVLEQLKERAREEGDGRYQTYLNGFLRTALEHMPTFVELKQLTWEVVKQAKKFEKRQKEVEAMLREIKERTAAPAKGKKRKA